MLLFCGFVLLRNPHYNLKKTFPLVGLNVRASILHESAGVPLKPVHRADCPFLGNYPAMIIYNIQVQVLIE